MIEIPEGVHRVGACSIWRDAPCWPFAAEEDLAIRRHWALRSAENPKFFNGRVHIMTSGALRRGRLEGSLAATDFAASLYWRETGFKDRKVVDCFGSAIFVASDGALVYGRQTPGNLNSGLIYPVSGFLDERDIGASGAADIDAGVAREVMEEMELDASAFPRDDGYLVTRDGPFLCVGVVYRLPMTGEEFCAQVKERLANDAAPELEGLVCLRSEADVARYAMSDYAARIAMFLLSRS
jgi:hypothetical protein